MTSVRFTEEMLGHVTFGESDFARGAQTGRDGSEFLKFHLTIEVADMERFSTDPRHANRNFGAVLAVWDYIFGTAVERGPEELAFGLTDERVPEGYFRQLLVPATGICAELGKDLGRLRAPAEAGR